MPSSRDTTEQISSFTYRKETLSAADYHALARSLRQELDVPVTAFLTSLSCSSKSNTRTHNAHASTYTSTHVHVSHMAHAHTHRHTHTHTHTHTLFLSLFPSHTQDVSTPAVGFLPSLSEVDRDLRSQVSILFLLATIIQFRAMD
jgi:hypothetical protein